MVKVDPNKNTIEMTRGDTLRVKFVAKKDGQPYVYQTGDKLHFYCKKNQTGNAELITEEIDTTTGELYLSAETTKKMSTGQYFYDIELEKANGDVDTIINRATLQIVAEVG